MAELILVRGLPGSGKSTFAQTLATGRIDWRHREADMWFTNDGNYQFNPADLPTAAHQWCQDATRELLRDGYNVVVSNTFVKRWEMEPYVKMASELGARLTVVEMSTQYGNVHGVPAEVVERMRQNWEPVEGSRMKGDRY